MTKRTPMPKKPTPPEPMVERTTPEEAKEFLDAVAAFQQAVAQFNGAKENLIRARAVAEYVEGRLAKYNLRPGDNILPDGTIVRAPE